MGEDGSRLNRDRAPDPDTTRRGLRLGALAGLTVIGILLCAYLAYPFLPALAWAVALVVMAFPIHARLSKVIPSDNWAAGVSTAVVVAIVLVPVLFVIEEIGREVPEASARAEAMARDGKVDAAADRVPYGTQILGWARQNNPEGHARKLVTWVTGDAGAIARQSAWFALQVLICVFVLFFAFRDWRHLLAGLEGLSPLSREEADYLFKRVADSIHATIYVTLLLSVLQGVTGGLLFWALGLPAPVLWGAVMFVLGILPIVGAFLVWVPAAVALALDDRWGSALLLVTWGLLMAGPIGNFAYGYLAGGRLRLHPVPVLIAFVGGLTVFGVSGMVLGPAILAVTVGLVDVWRRRLGSAPARQTSVEWTEPLREPGLAPGPRPQLP
jgi:predicted PurR-regulated permease PerM